MEIYGMCFIIGCWRGRSRIIEDLRGIIWEVEFYLSFEGLGVYWGEGLKRGRLVLFE